MKRLTAVLLISSIVIMSVFCSCNTKTDDNKNHRASEIASVYFSEEPTETELEYTLTGIDGKPTVGKLGGKEYFKLDSRSAELGIKLSRSAGEKTEDKDVFVILEYNENSSKELLLCYNSEGKNTEQTVKMNSTSTWGGTSVKAEGFKYDADAESDFTVKLSTATQLWIHSIKVVIAEKSEQSYPMAVSSEFDNSNNTVIAANVFDYGAVGDGKTDDSVAFKTALNHVANIGGTLYVPSGHYYLTQEMEIPAGVTLLGDFKTPTADDKKIGGTLLCVDPQTSADGNTSAFIKMRRSSALNGFNVWYTDQTFENGEVKEYPYLVSNVDAPATVVENLNMINVYDGIDHATVANQNQSVANIFGTPLHKGVQIAKANEVGRNEAINFSPDYWLESGLENIPEEESLKRWIKEYGIGFHILSVDWHFLSDINISGYNIGLKIDNFFGRAYDLNITDCETCVYVDKTANYGGQLTKGVLKASGSENAAALRIGAESVNGITCNSMQFESTGNKAVYHTGTSPITISDSLIKADTGIYMTAGRANIINTEFSGKLSFFAGENAGKSSLINCKMNDEEPKTESKTEGMVTVTNEDVGERTLIDTELLDEKLNLSAKRIKKPDAGTIITAELDEAAEDNSAVLQQAIDEVFETGGGTVYCPKGKYRLEAPITVKTGVTLLGSCDTFHDEALTNVTYFVTDYGKNEPDSVLISLEENSSARGFSISYDKIPQSYTEHYGWSFRGLGSNITLANVSVIGGFRVADFGTNRCDSHYIENVSFVSHDIGIYVGGGSQNGVMRWCTSNPALFWGNPYSVEKDWESEWEGKLISGQVETFTAFKVGSVKNEIMHLNFVFGANNGILAEEDAELYLIGQGVDYSMNSLNLKDSAKVISTDLQAVGCTGESAAVITQNGYSGTADIYSLTLWNIGGSAVKVNSGNVNIAGGVFFASGRSALEQSGGKVNMSGVITVQRSKSDITATGGELTAYGNLVTARIPRFEISDSVKTAGSDTE